MKSPLLFVFLSFFKLLPSADSYLLGRSSEQKTYMELVSADKFNVQVFTEVVTAAHEAKEKLKYATGYDNLKRADVLEAALDCANGQRNTTEVIGFFDRLKLDGQKSSREQKNMLEASR